MTEIGDRLVPKRGNSLSGFTAYKAYVVVAGTGDRNMSYIASKMHIENHSENSCNVIDDLGNIRFVTLDYFSHFGEQMGRRF